MTEWLPPIVLTGQGYAPMMVEGPKTPVEEPKPLNALEDRRGKKPRRRKRKTKGKRNGR